ncbi:MAG: Glu/Leu/Phe/Val dehydrogenase dimerization domain-containing protein [Pseudomonadota bacterium]|nr:Glu/Leu/Phe/Val dehydrogenase dimerization domain-containing protein [Pseudomonadota bacterium]
MSIFEQLSSYDHEQILFCRNDDVGLRAIIAVHNTTLGPALGGCRLYDYATEADAVRDVLRLSRGMTYKAAVAGLDLGGGKSVIIGDPSMKSEAMFRAFGRHVQSLSGRYITAEDMNTSVEDMDNIRRETKWVTGSAAAHGGSGDPSPVTAWGCYHGIRACLEVIYGSPEVAGRTIAIQGVGNVGYYLAKYLHEGGASLLYADISQKRLARVVEEFGGTVLEGDEFYRANCDVLAPCAIGGIINTRTIPMIKAPIIAGGANNQLDDETRDGEALAERGITYAPDYVINAGGLINVCAELKNQSREKAMGDAAAIFNTVKRIINKAKSEGTTTIRAANKVAEERIEAVGRLKRLYV